MNHDLLRHQLRSHWVASIMGVTAFVRVGRTHGIPEVAAAIRELAGEVSDDRDSLERLMAAVDIEPSTFGNVVARAGEKVGHFRPTGRLFGRSELQEILELEALISAVMGKKVGWDTLREAVNAGARFDTELLEQLSRRADDQLDRLAELHRRTAARHLST